MRALSRVVYQMASLTQSIGDHAEGELGAQAGFLKRYGDVLTSLAGVTEVLSGSNEGDDGKEKPADRVRELREAVEKAQSEMGGLTQHAEAGPVSLGPDYPYGLLMAEARRLTDEFRYTCEVFETAAGRSG